MTLQVIGAGFGRTGTLSLQNALETLGFAPCHHMVTVFSEPGRLALWESIWERSRRGEAIDWTSELGGFRATVDWPGCTYWRELAAAFPDAKVLLSVRDPERWYASALDTIYRMSQPGSLDPAIAAALPPEVQARMNDVTRYIDELIWQDTFQDRFLDREYALRVFLEHNEAVKAAIPADRLLVYEVKQGWGPLCDFLGVTAPVETPFPHLNDTAMFKERVQDFDEDAMRRMAAG